MTALRTLLILALLTTTGYSAGCLGGALPAAEGDVEAVAGAAEDSNVLGNGTRTRVYEFQDVVTGSSALESDAPAFVETFELPEGANQLVVKAEYYTGSGDGRVEVVDPEGVVVYRSGTYTYVGQPGSSAVGVTRTPVQAEDVEPPLAGTYEVRYHVTGSMEAVVSVSAAVPAQA